jgi:hypothetical protein
MSVPPFSLGQPGGPSSSAPADAQPERLAMINSAQRRAAEVFNQRVAQLNAEYERSRSSNPPPPAPSIFGPASAAAPAHASTGNRNPADADRDSDDGIPRNFGAYPTYGVDNRLVAARRDRRLEAAPQQADPPRHNAPLSHFALPGRLLPPSNPSAGRLPFSPVSVHPRSSESKPGDNVSQ